VNVKDSEGAPTSLIKYFVLGLHIVEGRNPLYSDPPTRVPALIIWTEPVQNFRVRVGSRTTGSFWLGSAINQGNQAWRNAPHGLNDTTR